jgi:hypothetical protein
VAARKIAKAHPSANVLCSDQENENADAAVTSVKRWLEKTRNTDWLLVFDNYDNPKLPGANDPTALDVRGFLPEAEHGSIIITTRSSRVQIGRRIKIGKLENIRHSLEILSDTSGRRETIEGEYLRFDVITVRKLTALRSICH